MRGELRQIMAEIGDLRRFESPRRLMGYLGLVPGGRERALPRPATAGCTKS